MYTSIYNNLKALLNFSNEEKNALSVYDMRCMCISISKSKNSNLDFSQNSSNEKRNALCVHSIYMYINIFIYTQQLAFCAENSNEKQMRCA